MNYDFERVAEKAGEKPRKFRLEKNLIPRRLAQYMAAGYRFQQQ